MSKWPELPGALEQVDADVLITAATKWIVPQCMLDRFGQRAVNFHPTLLPEYRGPSPYLPMLLDGRGDIDGGVTMHVLSAGIDEGDIIAQRPVPYSASGGSFTPWYAELIFAIFRLARDELPRYLASGTTLTPQVGGRYVKMRAPYLLDPGSSAAEIRELLGRAGSTYGMVVSVAGRRRKVIVTRVMREMPLAGTGPQLNPLSVELDFADARLRLSRPTKLQRELAKWELAWRLRPLQL